jgi:hypothetical protein
MDDARPSDASSALAEERLVRLEVRRTVRELQRLRHEAATRLCQDAAMLVAESIVLRETAAARRTPEIDHDGDPAP